MLIFYSPNFSQSGKSFSIAATIRFCSASGGRGNKNCLKLSAARFG